MLCLLPSLLPRPWSTTFKPHAHGRGPESVTVLLFSLISSICTPALVAANVWNASCMHTQTHKCNNAQIVSRPDQFVFLCCQCQRLAQCRNEVNNRVIYTKQISNAGELQLETPRRWSLGWSTCMQTYGVANVASLQHMVPVAISSMQESCVEHACRRHFVFHHASLVTLGFLGSKWHGG